MIFRESIVNDIERSGELRNNEKDIEACASTTSTFLCHTWSGVESYFNKIASHMCAIKTIMHRSTTATGPHLWTRSRRGSLRYCQIMVKFQVPKISPLTAICGGPLTTSPKNREKGRCVERDRSANVVG